MKLHYWYWLAALSASCSVEEDTVRCSSPEDVKLAFSALGDIEPVTMDLEVAGAIALPSDAVVYRIELAAAAASTTPGGTAASSNDPVYDMLATFDPPTTWQATIPLSKLLATSRGTGRVTISARAVTNCPEPTVAETAPTIVVAPPMDTDMDAM
jgi:hypothetical protein